MPTDGQTALIERAAAVVGSDPRVLAAWLAGSLANGVDDAYSDVDVHILVADGDLVAFRTEWAAMAARCGDIVTVQPVPGVVGGYAITRDWMHLDLMCYGRGTFDPSALRGCRPLFDRIGILPTEPSPSKWRGTPYFPADAVQLYYYLLGNLAVVLGRGELTLAMNGAVARRDVGLVPLMLAENGVRKTDGAKRLNPYLTDEQRAMLTSLPPLKAERASVIAYDRLVAAEFGRRGRALAAATGAAWPADLVEATYTYLKRELGMDIPEAP